MIQIAKLRKFEFIWAFVFPGAAPKSHEGDV